MLKYDPNERITAEEALRDIWITSNIKRSTQNITDLLVPNNNQRTSVLKNLENFNTERKLQGALFQYIANQLISPEEEVDLQELFNSMDDDGNGTLCREEFVWGMEQVGKHFQFKVTPENIDNLIKKIDTN
jgi:Ca2+-binding EF-hand superfamily protein